MTYPLAFLPTFFLAHLLTYLLTFCSGIFSDIFSDIFTAFGIPPAIQPVACLQVAESLCEQMSLCKSGLV